MIYFLCVYQVRVNSEQEHFLLVPFGLLYSEVTASSLVRKPSNHLSICAAGRMIIALILFRQIAMKPFVICSLGEGQPGGRDCRSGQHQSGRQPGRLHPPLCHLRVTSRCQVYRPHSHIGRRCGKWVDTARLVKMQFRTGFGLVVIRRLFGCRCRPWNAACCPSHLRRCLWARWPITITTAYWWTRTKRPSYRRAWGLPARWRRGLIIDPGHLLLVKEKTQHKYFFRS